MTYFFDIIIILFIIVDALLVFNLTHQILHWRKNRVSKLKLILSSLFLFFVLLCGVLVFYGSFVEPRRLVVHRQTLNLRSDSTKSLRLAFVADFHAGPYLSRAFVEKVARKITDENPDAVLIGGDFVTYGNKDAARDLAPIGQIRAPQGVYGVLGNHDYGPGVDDLQAMLEDMGIKMLNNESALLTKDNANLAIVGLDDLWFGNIDFEAATAGLFDETPQILLEHNPDIVYALGDRRFDAILSGHSHGGQIRLPWIGALMPIPTVLGRAYDRGFFDWQGVPLLITQGIGETGPRARLFNPPEVVIIDINF